MRKSLGLDRPPLVRFADWLSGLLSGNPHASPGELRRHESRCAFRPRLLALASCGDAVGTRYDRVVSMSTVSIVSVPEFLTPPRRARPRREPALAAHPDDDLEASHEPARRSLAAGATLTCGRCPDGALTRGRRISCAGPIEWRSSGARQHRW
jgi:hypothetical protein